MTAGSVEEFRSASILAIRLIVKFLDIDGKNADQAGAGTIEIDGRVWPNQAIAGLFGLTAIVLAALSFVGAQRHGNEVRAMKQPKEASVESTVLAAAGPSGPPVRRPKRAPIRWPERSAQGSRCSCSR